MASQLEHVFGSGGVELSRGGASLARHLGEDGEMTRLAISEIVRSGNHAVRELLPHFLVAAASAEMAPGFAPTAQRVFLKTEDRVIEALERQSNRSCGHLR